MRHFFNILRITILIVYTLSVFSCRTKEKPETEGGSSYITTDIITYSPAAEDQFVLGPAEYVIRRCRLYAFDGDTLDNMMYFENISENNIGAYVARMKVIQTTTKKLYCIINEPEDVEMQGRLNLINNPQAFAHIEYEIADYVTNGYNSDDTFDENDFCLPSFGESGVFSTITSTPQIDIPVELSVKRSLARVDIMIQKLSSVTSDVNITSSTTFSVINTRASGFIAPILTPSGNMVTKTVTGPSASLQAPIRDASDYRKNAIRAFSFYTPERTCDADADKLKIQLKDVDFGGALKTYDVVVDNETAPKLTKIERNRVYRLYCTFTSQGSALDLNLNINDWEEETPNGDIYGADFAVSSSKISIPVVNGEGSSKELTLNASENISFIEYEYNGTKGGASILPSGLTVTGIESINGTSTTGSVTLTSGSTSSATAPVYLWFQAGNIKKRVEVNSVEYLFRVSPPSDFLYTDGTKQYRVTSYSKLSGTALPWTATEFSTDGGVTWTTKPEWISAFTQNDAGSISYEEYSVTLSPTSAVYPHDAILKLAEPVSGIYNLATNGGASSSTTTANCYLVNAPGRYSLPLVYGNAIENGQTNRSAYHTDISEASVLSDFVKHDGAKITDPYIYNNSGCVPDNAVLIWQDAQNLVTEVALSDDKHSLTFYVDRATIKQGNALVAVRNSANVVLWSWHIWVTDYILGKDVKNVTNATSKNYSFLPYNLGWCDGPYFPARSVKVRFTQSESGAHKIIDINQLEGIEPGNNPFYQYGRKDPFVGGLKDQGTKIWYNAAGTPSSANPSTSSSISWDWSKRIASGILNPGIFCMNNDYEDKYLNLWCTDNTASDVAPNDKKVIKTVYDPSPVGFCVPPSNAFTGFTTANGIWNDNEGRWKFTIAGETIFFTAPGYRNVGSVASVGYYGGHWTATNNTVTTNYFFSYFADFTFRPLDTSMRNLGVSVRCIEE